MSTISFEDAEPGYYRDLMGWTEIALPSQADALNFLGAMHEIDFDPGEWNELLVKFALKCDLANRRKLRREFGGLVSAVILYKEHDNGFALLWKLANRWEDRPAFLRCLGGTLVKPDGEDDDFCQAGLSCANLGITPWTRAGCPLV